MYGRVQEYIKTVGTCRGVGLQYLRTGYSTPARAWVPCCAMCRIVKYKSRSKLCDRSQLEGPNQPSLSMRRLWSRRLILLQPCREILQAHVLRHGCASRHLDGAHNGADRLPEVALALLLPLHELR